MERIRAVIYCRVSTSSDLQLESLDKQVIEAEEAARGLGYDLVDRFIDEGKTGTTKYARKEYLRMLSAMENNRFDVIVTKSLDRMNRNILDFYLFLDLLLKNRIQLYFYLDRAFYKTDDKIVIGIKAILAEEYSRELSKKLCSAHKKRQERGEVVMLGSMTYGYRKEVMPDGSKRVEVVKEEEQMIRLIFDLCLQGYGIRSIADVLEERGYQNRKGRPIGESTVRRLIRNPLVTGTMIMNRVKYDFNTKTTVHTDPSQWIWKENAVPAIISKEDWDNANHMLTMRRNQGIQHGDGIKGISAGKHDLSGKIICGLCGAVYHRAGRKGKDGRVAEWRCSTYQRYGRKGCDNLTLKEDMIASLFEKPGSKVLDEIGGGRNLIQETMEVIKRVLGEESGREGELGLKEKLETAKNRKEILLMKYLDQKISDDTYAMMEARIEKEQKFLQRQLEGLYGEAEERKKVQKRQTEIEQRLIMGGVERAAAYAIMRWSDKIYVYPGYMEASFQTSDVQDTAAGQFQDGSAGRVHISLEDYFIKYDSRSIQQSKEMIFDIISKDTGIRVKEISCKLGMSEKTVYERIKLLKQEGRLKVSGHGRSSGWVIR